MSEKRDKAREKIAKMECDRGNPMMSDTKDHSFWEEKASEAYKTIYRNVADQILSIDELAIVDRKDKSLAQLLYMNATAEELYALGYIKEVKK